MSPAWRLRIEVVIVLGLTLGASAVYSIVSLAAKLTEERALGDQSVALNPSRSTREWLDFTYQFLDVFFGLFAVALVLYLLWVPGRSPFRRIGLDFTRPGRDAASGLLLVAVIGVPGLALYAIGRALGLSEQQVKDHLAYARARLEKIIRERLARRVASDRELSEEINDLLFG